MAVVIASFVIVGCPRLPYASRDRVFDASSGAVLSPRAILHLVDVASSAMVEGVSAATRVWEAGAGEWAVLHRAFRHICLPSELEAQRDMSRFVDAALRN